MSETNNSSIIYLSDPRHLSLAWQHGYVLVKDLTLYSLLIMFYFNKLITQGRWKKKSEIPGIFFLPSLSLVKLHITNFFSWNKIFQAYRGVRTHHLRVSLTFPQRFSPWRPRGCWCWGGVPPQVTTIFPSNIQKMDIFGQSWTRLRVWGPFKKTTYKG